MAEPARALPSIAELEGLCGALYQSTKADERAHAQRELIYFFPTYTKSDLSLSELHGPDKSPGTQTLAMAMGAATTPYPGADTDTADLQGLQAFFATQPIAMATNNNNSNSSQVGPYGALESVNTDPTVKTPLDATERLLSFLSASTSPYAHFFVAARLTPLFLQYFNGFSAEAKLEARNYLLNFLASRPDRPAFTTTAITQVLTTVTKLAWFDAVSFRMISADVDKWMDQGPAHQALALHVLSLFVEEINQESPSRFLAKQRKMMVHFRDSQLLKIFELGYNTLQSTVTAQPAPPYNQVAPLMRYSLQLLQACLRFDFVGFCPDESAEDNSALQLPIAWKHLVQKPQFLDTFFTAYRKVEPGLATQIIECLMLLFCIRRSFFTEETRQTYLKEVLQGVTDIMTSGHGFNDPDTFLALCRLLARFRAVYTFAEMDDWPELLTFLERTAAVCGQGLLNWQYCPLAIHPILAFWAKVCSTRSKDAKLLALLKDIAQRLLAAYIDGSMNSVPSFLEDPSDHPLANEEELADNIKLLADIGRFDYRQAAEFLIGAHQALAGQYRHLLEAGNASSSGGGSSGSGMVSLNASLPNLRVVEDKLTWLTYVISALVGGRVPYQSTEDEDKLDGDLISHVFQTIALLQERARQVGVQHLDCFQCAILFIFRQFRTTYISDQSYGVPKAFGQLQANLGLDGKTQVMEAMVQTIIRALEMFPAGSPVVVSAVTTLNEFTLGYTSLRLMAKLDSAQSLLANHASPSFGFLRSLTRPKDQLVYYNALTKLLCTDDIIDDHFAGFIAPFNTLLDEITRVDDATFAQDPSIKLALHRTFYHLRGVLFSVQSRKNLMLFFDWMYPAKLKLVERAIRTWPGDPIQTAALKFWLEFVHNKSQRLSFDVSSAYGVLIFRETSRILDSYYQTLAPPMGRFNPVEVAQDERYKRVYKGMLVSFNVLTRSLAGRYIAFGVFALYKDPALEVAVETCLRLIKSIPNSDLFAYRKLTDAVYALLEELTDERIVPMVHMDQTMYLLMMKLVAQGMYSPHVALVNAACNILVNVGEFVHYQTQRAISSTFLSSPVRVSMHSHAHNTTIGDASSSMLPLSPPVPLALAMGGAWNQPQHQHPLLSGYRAHPQVFPFLLVYLVNTLLFEERPNQWSLTRALYGVAALHKATFIEYVELVAKHQPPEIQQPFVKAFSQLLADVDLKNFKAANRDYFCKRANEFCREMVNSNLILVPPDSSPFVSTTLPIAITENPSAATDDATHDAATGDDMTF